MRRERCHQGEVVALSEYRKLQDRPEISLVRSYWERLRGTRPAPARSEIDPRGIGSALGQAFILDQIAPGHAKFRIAGMHLCDLMGMEVRGMPLATLFHVTSREPLSALVGEVFRGEFTLCARLRADHGLGRPALDAQMLLLPLTDRQGAVAHALGCLASSGSIGYPPRRFTLAEVYRRRVLGDKARLAPTEAPEAAVAGFAEPRSAYRPRPVFRVISNDE